MNTPAQAELGRGTLKVCGDAQAGPPARERVAREWSSGQSLVACLRPKESFVVDRTRVGMRLAIPPSRTERGKGGAPGGKLAEPCSGEWGFVFTAQPERLGKISRPMVSWNPPNVAKDATLGWGTRRTRPPAQNAGRVGHPAGDEPGQPRTPPLRKNLQYRPPSPGSRLPNPSPVSPPELIPTKRMKSVTYPLDEYTGLTVPCNETRVEGE
jgi:hypothetical protein